MKLALLMVLALNVASQADPWEHHLTTDLTGSQVQFKDWSGGGEDALAWEYSLDGRSTLKTDSYAWSWRYRFDYGQSQQGDRGPRKTDDRLSVTTTYLRNTESWVRPYVSAGIRTQIDAGYRYGPKRQISDFWDPVRINEAAGIGRTFERNNLKIQTRAGASFRHVTQDGSTATDFGVESVADIVYDISETSTLTTQVKAFRGSGQPWVLRSENVLRVELTKRIVLKAKMTALKDERLTEDWQLKQSTQLGIGWSL